eukprot:1693592-Prymnesium_polylepis.1
MFQARMGKMHEGTELLRTAIGVAQEGGMAYERGLATKELGKATSDARVMREALALLAPLRALADCRELEWMLQVGDGVVAEFPSHIQEASVRLTDPHKLSPMSGSEERAQAGADAGAHEGAGVGGESEGQGEGAGEPALLTTAPMRADGAVQSAVAFVDENEYFA